MKDTSPLLRQGSVKNLRQAQREDQLWFEFTDNYSVFDWGKMPDTIAGKGQALAELAEYFFIRLADEKFWNESGLSQHQKVQPYLPIGNHFLRSEQNAILVSLVDIPSISASQLTGILVYDYSYGRQARQLVPLEVIFRFGVPAGSSLLKRESWYSFPIHEGAEFEEPLIEFSTKLESKDRMLSYQEAILMLGGDFSAFRRLHGKSQAVALGLKSILQECGLKLWDGKLEWARWDNDFLLVDSIGPDELRVSREEVVFSKQFLRDFYSGTPWESAVHEGRRLAKERAEVDWVSIVKEDLKIEPPPLEEPWLRTAEYLYQDFAALVINRQPSDNFIRAFRDLQRS